MNSENIQETVATEETSQEVSTTQAAEIQTYSISNPAQTLELANELKKYVEQQGLSTEIQSNKYVLVEGWQFALSQLGIVPIVCKTVDHSTREDVTFSWMSYNKQKEHKTKLYRYEAHCQLIQVQTGKVVGYGVAICSNEEQKKHTFDEYAVLSMAQTRSIGKAARMLIGWLMKAAGYEATPAEEMSDGMTVGQKLTKAAEMTSDLKKKIKSFRSEITLVEWGSEQPDDVKKNEDFRALVQYRIAQLAKARKAREEKAEREEQLNDN